MQTLWWMIGINLVLGLLMAAIGVLKASDGYEDETGFHPCPRSGRRLTSDPVCTLPSAPWPAP